MTNLWSFVELFMLNCAVRPRVLNCAVRPRVMAFWQSFWKCLNDSAEVRNCENPG